MKNKLFLKHEKCRSFNVLIHQYQTLKSGLTGLNRDSIDQERTIASISVISNVRNRVIGQCDRLFIHENIQQYETIEQLIVV